MQSAYVQGNKDVGGAQWLVLINMITISVFSLEFMSLRGTKVPSSQGCSVLIALVITWRALENANARVPYPKVLRNGSGCGWTWRFFRALGD